MLPGRARLGEKEQRSLVSTSTGEYDIILTTKITYIYNTTLYYYYHALLILFYAGIFLYLLLYNIKNMKIFSVQYSTSHHSHYIDHNNFLFIFMLYQYPQFYSYYLFFFASLLYLIIIIYYLYYNTTIKRVYYKIGL